MNGITAEDAGVLGLTNAVQGMPYNYFNHGNFSGDGSAIKAALTEHSASNRAVSAVGAVNDSARERNIVDNIVRGNEFLTDRINNNFLNERFSSLERLMFANKADTDRDLKAMELKLTQCCCELKSGQAAILEKVAANAVLQEKNAEIAQLKTQLLVADNRPGNS